MDNGNSPAIQQPIDKILRTKLRPPDINESVKSRRNRTARQTVNGIDPVINEIAPSLKLFPDIIRVSPLIQSLDSGMLCGQRGTGNDILLHLGHLRDQFLRSDSPSAAIPSWQNVSTCR